MRTTIAILLMAGCSASGVDARDATTWLESRGAASATWEPCVRMAVAMRSECGADESCANGVTSTFSYWCYVGRYRVPSHDHSATPASLSPCFWDRDGSKSVESWATSTCEHLHLPARPCEAELHDVIAMCNVDLTGAGP